MVKLRSMKKRSMKKHKQSRHKQSRHKQSRHKRKSSRRKRQNGGLNLGQFTDEERIELNRVMNEIFQARGMQNKIAPLKNLFRFLLVHPNLFRGNVPKIMLEKIHAFVIDLGDLVTDDFEYNDLSNRVKELAEEAQEAKNNDFIYAN